MIMLAIETTGIHGGVAVLKDGRLQGEINLSGKETFSKRLFFSIEFLFDRLGAAWQDMELIAVSIGPGSFTGIRIGLSAAKGFSMARDIPVMGVPTLDALASNVYMPDGSLICPVIDAKRSQIYTALYQFQDHRPVRISPYQAIYPDEIQQNILVNNKIFFLGEGLLTYRDKIHDAFMKRAAFLPSQIGLLRAASVGVVANDMIDSGVKISDPNTLEPIYVRLSEAEEKKKRRESSEPWRFQGQAHGS
jgi:tRNA threonylcarbamoyladenosine biosynthesis protein TsaB